MSVTTWTRIEPDTQLAQPSLDLGEGIAARLADPLWLLGRQWQVGELQGEDAASPVKAHLDATSFAIDGIDTRAGTAPFAAASMAAEALVEHDGSAPDIRTRAAGGMSFLDRLQENGLERYRNKVLELYGFQGSPPGSVFTGPGFSDGERLLADLDHGALADRLAVESADQPVFDSTVRGWAGWFRPRAARTPNPAWIPDRLEYRFSLGATVTEGRLVLEAPEHTGDRIDWDSFSAQPFAAAVGQASPQAIAVDTVPLLLEIPGMPSPWFWELEDPRFDPGRIEAGPSDTARLLLIEAALAYATDWFLMPLRLPVASVSRIDSLRVTDTFGVTTVIRETEQVRPHSGWGLWRVTQGAGSLPYLLLPPPTAGFLTGEPVEEVAMVRDEAANLAWALHTVPYERTVAPESPKGSGDLTYVPMTPLPDDRVPLLLVETTAGRSLVEGRMVNQEAVPESELLPAGFSLRDEELPDEGLVLRRRFELGRTPDGALHLWVSRAKAPGARLPASGLEFDRLISEPRE